MGDQDQDARRLLAPLAGEPAGPSSVDIRRAIADGRRRLRTRRLVGASAVAAATVMIAAGVPVALDRAGGTAEPPPVAATPGGGTASPTAGPGTTEPTVPSRCEMSYLPVPDGVGFSELTGGDPSGRILLGTASYAPPGQQVLYWKDGDLTTVDIPGVGARLVDANAGGAAVGNSYASSRDLSTGQAWFYRDGQVTRLPGESVQAVAVNDAAMVVGSRGVGEESTGVPVVWRSPESAPEPLSLPRGEWVVRATDVDADGTVVGTGADLAERPDPPERSFVWLPDGTRHELPWPTINGTTADGFRAESIRNGVVTGIGIDGGRHHQYQYDLVAGDFTPLADGVEIGAYAWNRAGWVVGGTADGLMLLAGSRLVPLPQPELKVTIPDVSPRQFLLGEDGRTVAGTVLDEDADFRAAVWRCR